MDIDKLFESESLDGIADNVFGVVNNSVSEVKEMQRKKVAENVQLVVNALKKIESDISSRYDSVGNALEKRIITIKDGRDGADGSDGRNGRDGKNGRDGAPGPRGADGKNGLDGADGIDGVSVTNAHIDFDGSLVISLSSGQEINVGEVVAPALAEQIKVITNGGGTSQSVIDTLASLQAQITAISGASIYKGLWNASTNTPTLASGVGTSGNFYIVSVAGSTNLDGITNWGVGDWAIYNGTAWQRVEGGAAGNFTTVTASSLTSGRVTYAGTAGLLQDSANLTFNGTTLTANTIGAFTLGGTVSGGGNQLNNVVIGTTTPLAGAFTTLSATGTSTLAGVTATKSSGTVATFTQTGATGYGLVIVPGADTVYDAFGINNAANTLNMIRMFGNGTATFAGGVGIGGAASPGSTGLAVTGTLSASGNTNGTFDTTVTNTSTGTAAQSRFVAVGGSSTILSSLSSGFTTSGQFQANRGLIYNTGSAGLLYGVPSGNHIWTNDAGVTANMTLSSTGLTVTGTLSATGVLSTTNTATGELAFIKTTNASGGYLAFYGNTSTLSGFLGSEISVRSAGSVSNFAIRSAGDINVCAGSGGIVGNFSSTGLAVTGTLTSTLDATIYGLTVGRGGGSILTNTAFGSNALQANTSGTSNVAIGNNALKLATITLGNTAVGSSALAAYARTASVTGRNTAIGQAAMSSNTDGVNNTAVGYNAFSGGTGSANTCIGLNSGSGITSGNSNVILGAYAGSTAPISATGSNYIALSDGDGNVRGYFDSSGIYYVLGTNGQVLCGTTTSSGNFSNSTGSAGIAFYGATHATVANKVVVTPGTNGVYMNSGATAWTAVSDERFKDIIEPISDAVTKVSSLRAVIGKFKTDEKNVRRSFLIAQDVQAVLPEAIDATNPDQLGVAYTDVIPLLVAAIKELSAKVTALENK